MGDSHPSHHLRRPCELRTLPYGRGQGLDAALAALLDYATCEWDAERVCAGLAATIESGDLGGRRDLAGLLPVTEREVLGALALVHRRVADSLDRDQDDGG